MKTSKKLIVAMCAILFATQISFAQAQSVYDVKTQKKIAKIEEKERADIQKARLEIDKMREKAIQKADKERINAESAREQANILRGDLDLASLKIQNKAHEDILALTSQAYETGDEVKEMKEREKKIAAINKDAIKSIEKLRKETEKAEKNAEKAEKNASKAQQNIAESVRKAEEKADRNILKIRSKTRDNIAKIQPRLY